MKFKQKAIWILLSGLLIVGCASEGVSSKSTGEREENKSTKGMDKVTEQEVEDEPLMEYFMDGQLYKFNGKKSELVAKDMTVAQTKNIKDIDTGEEWVYEIINEDNQAALYFRKSKDSDRIFIDKGNEIWINKTIDLVTNHEYIWYSKADTYWQPQHWEPENVTAYILKAGKGEGIELGFDENGWSRGASQVVVIDSIGYYATNTHGNDATAGPLNNYDEINPKGAHLPLNTIRCIDLAEEDREKIDMGIIFDPWEIIYEEDLSKGKSLYTLPYCKIFFSDKEYVYVSTGKMNADSALLDSIYSISTDTKEVREIYGGSENMAYSGGSDMLVTDDVLYISSSGRILETMFLRIPLKNQCQPFEKYNNYIMDEKDGWVYYRENNETIYRIETTGDTDETVYTAQEGNKIYGHTFIGDWIIFNEQEEDNYEDDGFFYRINTNTKEVVELEKDTPLTRQGPVKEGVENKTYFIAYSKEDGSNRELYRIDNDTFEMDLITSGKNIRFKDNNED
ncbi:MAG TPA: hypothetical protein GX707_17675 [Epulopiscium sp.]|nr:hypothetical protein [Candidatus Epulonipiscium sp.]